MKNLKQITENIANNEIAAELAEAKAEYKQAIKEYNKSLVGTYGSYALSLGIITTGIYFAGQAATDLGPNTPQGIAIPLFIIMASSSVFAPIFGSNILYHSEKARYLNSKKKDLVAKLEAAK
ncbi:MAG: hypothetical protein V1660_02555 [archaeon]